METIIKPHRRALVVATTVLLGGITASLAGNLQAINLGDAQPGIGAYISAVLWPLFLFGAIEVMLHTPWIRSWRDALTKWAGLASVAAVSLWVSYWHLVHVLHAFNYDAVSSHAGPLAIDLTMAMSTMALNRVGQARRGPEATMVNFASVPEDPFKAWEAEMDMDPVVTRPVSPAPEVSPASVPRTAVDLFTAWLSADTAVRPRAGEMYALVAADHEVTPRTARRWFYAVRDSLA